jgi:hypothetical protein
VPAEQEDGDEDQDEHDGHVDDDQQRHRRDGPGVDFMDQFSPQVTNLKSKRA